MSINTKGQRNRCSLEKITLLLIIKLLIITILGNYFYRDISLLVRTLVTIIIIFIAGRLAIITAKGQLIINFAREAHTEVRKVIWPTCQKTLHITLIVAAVTTIMSLIMLLLDSILVKIVSFTIGLRF